MQQDRVPQCSRLNAPHCLLDTCYIVRVQKNRQKQLASAIQLMAQDRLSSLALIHIHYHMEIDLDEVVTIFSVRNHTECNSQIFCVTEVLCSTLESAKGSLIVSSCYTFECCTLGL